MDIEMFWKNYLTFSGRPADFRYTASYHFELSEKAANALLQLVLTGEKRATASALRAYEIEGEPLPRVGDCTILTDWAGEPHCVIETTAVTLLPYRDVTFDICRREGEDESLTSWQRGHQRYFEQEGRELGYAFSPELIVIFEDFQVVYRGESV